MAAFVTYIDDFCLEQKNSEYTPVCGSDFAQADDGNPPMTALSQTSGEDIADHLAGNEYVESKVLPTVTFKDYQDGEFVDVTIGGETGVSYTLVTNASGVIWKAGYYVIGADYNEDGVIYVKDSDPTLGMTIFAIVNSAIVSGDVWLILADGFTLSVTGGKNHAGIEVAGNSNSFTVCGQTDGSGILVANGGKNSAGIGGGNHGSGSNITINGGEVTANGGEFGAGIGGGYFGSGSNITVNGGKVTAAGGEAGAGIGGGAGAGIGGSNDSGAGFNITINGGSVTATGNKYGAGIGGGKSGSGFDITISDGTVTANGGYFAAGIGGGNEDGRNITISGGTVTANGGEDGSGIGGGYFGSGSDVTVSGGTVTANGGGGGAGIGGGWKGNATDITVDGGTVTANGGNQGSGIGGGVEGDGSGITISGGEVTANGGFQGAGIGGGVEGDGSGITISGGKVIANGGENGAGIGGGDMGDGSGITVSGGEVAATGGEDGSGIGGGYHGSGSDITADGDLIVKADNDYPSATEIAHTSETDIADELAGKKYVTVEGNPPTITFKDYQDGKFVDVTIGGESGVNYTLIPSGSNISLHDGYYVVGADYNEDGVIDAADAALGINVFSISSSVPISGNVKLILADGFTLTVTGSESRAGIEVTGDDNSFTVYGQANGTGVLSAVGGEFGAGIGGGDNESGSNITINGGTVIAVGGEFGAGIGGGYFGSGSNITVNGGKVLAAGGEFGDGIGGGFNGSGSEITVNGNLIVKADNSNPPTTAINHTSEEDIADDLAGKKYVTIEGGVFLNNTWKAGEEVTATCFGSEVYGVEGDGTFFRDPVEAKAAAVSRNALLVIAGGTASWNAHCDGIKTRVETGTASEMFFGGEIFSAPQSAKADEEPEINAAEVKGSCWLNIGDGVFKKSVAAGDSVENQFVTRKGDIRLEAEGGTFGKRIAGGMYYTGDSESGSATLDGNVYFSIRGGTFSGRIYAGCNAQNDALGGNTRITGNIELEVDSSIRDIYINQHVVAGSRGAGIVDGNVSVTFTGNGDKLHFAATSVVFGGSNSDFTSVDAKGVRTTVSTVKGSRDLVFTAFTGDFGAELRMFKTATFEDASQVNFTNGSLDMWAVETWNFEFGSSGTNLAANDFDKDTLNFDLTGYDDEEWTVLTGSTGAFDNFGSAAAVNFGTSAAVYYSDGNYWADSEYKLALNGSGTAMIVSKLG